MMGLYKELIKIDTERWDQIISKVNRSMEKMRKKNKQKFGKRK